MHHVPHPTLPFGYQGFEIRWIDVHWAYGLPRYLQLRSRPRAMSSKVGEFTHPKSLPGMIDHHKLVCSEQDVKPSIFGQVDTSNNSSIDMYYGYVFLLAPSSSSSSSPPSPSPSSASPSIIVSNMFLTILRSPLRIRMTAGTAAAAPDTTRRVLLIGGQFTGNFCARELKKKFYAPRSLAASGWSGWFKEHDIYG